MQMKSDGHRYGAVAMAMHWATAIAIFGLLGSGLVMADTDDAAVKATLLKGHAAAGVFITLLTVLRISWWAFADRRPEKPEGTPAWQARVANIVHGMFYVVILVMGASGVAMLVLSGAASVLASGQGRLPDFALYAPRAPHGAGAWLMMMLIAAHVGAALYHQFIRHDRLLARMGLG